MKKIIFLLVVIAGLYVSSCKCKGNDCPCDGDNCESELITSVILTFVNDSINTDTLVYAFRDPDGDGANLPTQFDTIRLATNTDYSVFVQILNESVSPVENLTDEIGVERNEHQFFYHFTNLSLVFSYNDSDTNVPPQPVGIYTHWKTGAGGAGTSQIVLKHQPNGEKANNEAVGDTDVDIIFQTIVE